MPTNNENQYLLYIDQVTKMASSIVVKSEDAIEAMNNYIAAFGGAHSDVDHLRPNTWRYYLHVSGVYHPFDTEMYVTSMDTLETILFSKETLKLHRATARGYAFGSRNYLELINKFPTQELLIRGILNPCKIDFAINAPDSTILSYIPELVEPNEYSFIYKLQEWINAYRLRWYNEQFIISDNLYPAVFLGIMYLQMVPAILNIRLGACKTVEAHSFHVRQYLASHGFEDFYIDYLTTAQAMFFYRNICYIERNSGQTNIFEWLVENIASIRNVPIAEYSVRHNVHNQPENLYPEVTFRRKPLNLGYSIDTRDNITLKDMLLKERAFAAGNAQYGEDHIQSMQETFENSPSNVLRTKALESSMIDDTDSAAYTMEDILLNQWIFMSFRGLYNTIVSIQHPKTGEYLPFTAKEAFIAMWYFHNRALGDSPQWIPPFTAIRVPILPMPSVAKILSVTEPQYVPVKFAETIRDLMPDIVPVISTEAFYDLCGALHKACNKMRDHVAYFEHKDSRGQAFCAMEQLFSDTVCELASPGELFVDWFAARNISITDFTVDENANFAMMLLRETTGLALTSTKTIRNLQKAMLGILGRLSSYSVQFLSEINDSKIRKTDWSVIRVGDMHSWLGDVIHYENHGVEPLELRSMLKTTIHQRVKDLLPDPDIRVWFSNTMKVPIIPKHTIRNDIAVAAVHNEIARIVPTFKLEREDYGNYPAVPGIDDYLRLTPEQRAAVKDIYHKY